MDNLIEYISELSSEIDRVSIGLQQIDYDSKELQYAIQKLKEAVFWLTFVEEDLGGNNEDIN